MSEIEIDPEGILRIANVLYEEPDDLAAQAGRIRSADAGAMTQFVEHTVQRVMRSVLSHVHGLHHGAVATEAAAIAYETTDAAAADALSSDRLSLSSVFRFIPPVEPDAPSVSWDEAESRQAESQEAIETIYDNADEEYGGPGLIERDHYGFSDD